MKDLTKLFCDLISFGTQLDKQEASLETLSACLAGIYLENDCCSAGIIIDYKELKEHLYNLKSVLRGSDFDIDLRTKSVVRIIEERGKLSIALSDGTTCANFPYNEIVHI